MWAGTKRGEEGAGALKNFFKEIIFWQTFKTWNNVQFKREKKIPFLLQFVCILIFEFKAK